MADPESPGSDQNADITHAESNPRKDSPETDKETLNNVNQDELVKTAQRANEVLVKAESVFPFNLFPDTIAVSRMKVAITLRQFFKVSEVISLQIEDILNVESDAGPFFGSLKIRTRIYGTKPLRITFLSRNDTIKVKRVLEGSIIARNQNIDVVDIPKDDLCALLNRLGSDKRLTN